MRRKSGTAKSLPVGFALGFCCSLAVTLCASAITAYFIHTEKMDQTQIGYASIITLILAAAAGSMITKQAIKTKPLLACGGTALLYYIGLLGVTALFFGGQYQGMGTTAICILIGASITAILSGMKKSTAKTRKKIHLSR